jgi:hypothetical protein
MSLRPAAAPIFPLQSAAVLIGESAATTIPFHLSPVAWYEPLAMIVTGRSLRCARIDATGLALPIS